VTVQDLNTPLRCDACGREGSKGFQRINPEGGLQCTNRASCDRRREAAEAKSRPPRCVDCVAEGITTARPIVTEGKLAKFSGPGKPRCVTHARERKKASRTNRHARMVEQTYGITGEQYWALYEAQGGKCAICRWATGKTKRLAVDHDHETGRVLGLLCGRCNQNRGFYGNETLVRWIDYNLDPPAPKTIGDVFARFENMDFDDERTPAPCGCTCVHCRDGDHPISCRCAGSQSEPEEVNA
jgi:hypothetical protein